MEFDEHVSAQEHDAFVRKHSQCDLLQSSGWAKVKHQWHHEIVGVREDGNLIAVVLSYSENYAFVFP